MNPIERMRQVADLLISQRRYRESYTIYDELHRQMWSVFGTVQSELALSSPNSIWMHTPAGQSTRKVYAEPAASVLCARMYGVSLSLALEEFIRVIHGHLQCVACDPAVSGEIPSELALNEFLVLYTLVLQPERQKKITPIFSIVTAIVDRDHRFRRLRPNAYRSTVEKQLLEQAHRCKGTEWRGLNRLLADYLLNTGQTKGDLYARILALAGPFSSRFHSWHSHSNRQDRHQRSDRYENSERRDRRTGGSRTFDATEATDDEKRQYYGSLFGLSGKVTKSQIRSRYIESVALYHPDKVQHLGPELKQLAEEKTKEINAAYDWLSAKYEI